MTDEKYKGNGKEFWEDFGKMKSRMHNVEEDIDEILHNHLVHIEANISSIEKKLNSRPSWSVSIVITFLTGLCVLLIREWFVLQTMLH